MKCLTNVICMHGQRNVAVCAKVTSPVLRRVVGSKAPMNPLLHALSLLILLRCGAVKLPPICDQWSPLTLNEIWDTHLVLCLSIEGDVAAAWTFHAIRLSYDWTSLGRSLPVLKEMWFRFVKKNIPLPRSVLEAGDTIHKRLKGFTLANFPDENLSVPWSLQCEAAVRELHASVDSAMAPSSTSPRTPDGVPVASISILDSPDLRSLQPVLDIESSPEPPSKCARRSATCDAIESQDGVSAVKDCFGSLWFCLRGN